MIAQRSAPDHDSYDPVLDDGDVERQSESVEYRLYAQRAVVTHRPERWPAGTYCANCHAIFPCAWRRWAERLLVAAGWQPAEVAQLGPPLKPLPPWA